MLRDESAGQTPNIRISVIARSLARMFPLVYKEKPTYLIIMLVIRIMQAGIPGVQILMTTRLIDAVNGLINGDSYERSAILLAVQFGIFLFASSIKLLDDLYTHNTRLHIRYLLERKMVEKSSRLPLIFFDQSNSYDMMQRAQSAQFGVEFFNLAFSIIQNTITLITLLVVLWKINAWFMLFILMAAVPSFFISFAVSKLKFKQSFQMTPLTRMVNYLFSILTGREYAKEIRLFGIQNELTRRWADRYRENFSAQIKVHTKSIKLLFAYDSAVLFFSTGLISFALYLCFIGGITIGQFVAMFQTTFTFRSTIQSLSGDISQLYSSSLHTSQYFDYLELPDEETRSGIHSLALLKKGIEVKKLSLTYPSRTNETLHDVSFTIHKGEKIAIVGANGAGKTSLVKCLLGLYTHYNGQIYFDEHELRDYELPELRRNLSALFQDFVKYEMSLRDNIGLGDVLQMDNLHAIEAAADKAGVQSFVHQLQRGYDTALGPSFLGGQELSIGQWQKVAISRAIMRDAQVFVLDEPTASLDPLSEIEILQNFIHLTEDKTAIIISHRLGICKHVDRVLVMEGGRLEEEGSHEELLHANGVYARMFEAQSEWYK